MNSQYKINQRRIYLSIFLFLSLAFFLWVQREQILEETASFLSAASPIHKVDLIVALGGGGEERKEKAARIFKRGYAPKLLFLDRNIPISHYKQFGVPPESICNCSPQIARNTYEEAISVLDVAKKKNLNSILIVTSFYHLRRAAYSFRRVFRGSGVQLFFSSARPAHFDETNWWRSPSLRRDVLHEYIGLVYYWLTV